MKLELQGRRALVTGGTKGVGETVVTRLLESGANALTAHYDAVCQRSTPKSGLLGSWPARMRSMPLKKRSPATL
jgi:hypothetical protein